jgi:hypothetical protein
MFENIDIKYELTRLRDRTHRAEDRLIDEANRILRKDLFAEKKILENLSHYNQTFEKLDEENLDEELVFTVSEIRQVAVTCRLKFLESKLFKPEIPYEAVLKIKKLNDEFHKDIKEFKILAPHECFMERNVSLDAMIFAETNSGNYYLVHRWGRPLKWHRKLKYLPLRSFETLVVTLLVTTFIITMSLPTALITLDHKAGYWSGYRAAAFFHLLIFNFGVTAYITFAFAKNFSSSVWNRYKDFD